MVVADKFGVKGRMIINDFEKDKGNGR